MIEKEVWMRRKTTWRALVAAVVVGLVAVVFASLSASSGTAGSVAAPTATPVKAYTNAQWARVVAAAKREGSVTLYTTQNPTLIADMAEKFKQKYGITVTVNRNIDAVLVQQVTAEHGSNNVKADIWASASVPQVLGAHQQQNRWVADARGPDLFKKSFSRDLFVGPGKAVIVGEAILGMGWNTSQFPGALTDMPDLLNPRLKGRIGVPIPSSPSFVDYYNWVEATYGRNFLSRLAAQEPKLYASSLPMTQAVASGEIAASPFVVPTILDLKNQGAPVGFKLAKGTKTWNAPYYGMIMGKAPHPNAAQVLLNYMITREGQAASQRLAGVVQKNVPNAFYVEPRRQKLRDLTPAKVAEFQRRWDALFRK
jgi:iron(III) transport system substrate-binding protein